METATATSPRTVHHVPAAGLTNPYNEQGHSSSVRTGLRIIIAGRSFGLSYVDATGESRRTHGGPILPGPDAGMWGMASVIDNFGGTGREIAESRAAGLLITAEVGDVLAMPDGELFAIKAVRFDRHNFTLARLVEA